MPWVDPNTHGWLACPSSDADWDALLDEYGGSYSPPLRQVFQVARDGGCRSVVVENRYVDLDYRSEYSAFWSRKFDSIPAFARRLHFFEDELEDAELHNLPDEVRYLGYSVIRPLPWGRVGRTVLKPPPVLDKATLTLIDDEVSLFGNDLVVRGVPFCQQDAEFLRCAQAATWICHYVAARRELVGRETTASIVESTPTFLSEERALPSKGMNLNQLQAVFGELGQPALLYDLDKMPDVSGVATPSPVLGPDGKTPLPPGHWDTRMISVICRYLNSGFPVLVAGQGHAFALVGWLRDAGDVKFVACDDQVGPYEIIQSPFGHQRTPWEYLMVPLPPKVFLSGEGAEGRAYRDFRAVALKSAPLKPLADALTDGQLELRSTLKEGRRFKLDVREQTSSDDTLRVLRQARLPHWVWLIEAHRVQVCHKEPCVYAAALYDATSFDLSPRMDALSVPGAVGVYPPDDGKVVMVQGGPAPWRSMLVAH